MRKDIHLSLLILFVFTNCALAQQIFYCDSLIENGEGYRKIYTECDVFYNPLSGDKDSVTMNLGDSFEQVLVEKVIYSNLNYGEYRVFIKNQSDYSLYKFAELDSNGVFNGISYAYNFNGEPVSKANLVKGKLNGLFFRYEWLKHDAYRINYIHRYVNGSLAEKVFSTWE